jgi:hypothetical protein
LFRRDGAVAAIAQLERGESGTPHFQCFVRYKANRKFTAMAKKFPKAHIEIARNAYKSWKYCEKEETRVEPPQHFGEMPHPPKEKGSNYQDYNLEVVTNLEGMVADGRVNIKDYARLKQSA